MRVHRGAALQKWAGCLLMFLLAGAALAVSPGQPIVSDPAKGQLVVHEWGTFLSVQGSDGVGLGGMVDSDEVLPPFVESRGVASWQRVRFSSKVETPVTYFYTDRPRTVQVRVDMPKGLLTHWFPPVCIYGPNPTKPTDLAKGSYVDWCEIKLIPDQQPRSPQYIDATNRLKKISDEQTWKFVRETDSALIEKVDRNNGQAGTQYEKFLFYRGLGTFGLPLSIRSTEDTAGLQLDLRNTDRQPLEGLFLINVEHGTIRFAAMGELTANSTHTVAPEAVLSPSMGLADGVASAKSAVCSALVAAGLYPKEAQAMVNTWERSYFRTDGLRVLYLLPRPTSDQVLPIEIKPRPDHLVRVMVGRVEVLTPSRERQIEKFVSELGASEFQVRESASRKLAHLGRITEPVLRRVMATTTDAEVRVRAGALIAKISASN